MSSWPDEDAYRCFLVIFFILLRFVGALDVTMIVCLTIRNVLLGVVAANQLVGLSNEPGAEEH